jgi:hypothetical protein
LELRQGLTQSSLLRQLPLCVGQSVASRSGSLSGGVALTRLHCLGQSGQGLGQVAIARLCSASGRVGQGLGQRLPLGGIHFGQLLRQFLQRLGRPGDIRCIIASVPGQGLKLGGQSLQGCLARLGFRVKLLAQGFFNLRKVGQRLSTVASVGAELLRQFRQLTQELLACLGRQRLGVLDLLAQFLDLGCLLLGGLGNRGPLGQHGVHRVGQHTQCGGGRGKRSRQQQGAAQPAQREGTPGMDRTGDV